MRLGGVKQEKEEGTLEEMLLMQKGAAEEGKAESVERRGDEFGLASMGWGMSGFWSVWHIAPRVYIYSLIFWRNIN